MADTELCALGTRGNFKVAKPNEVQKIKAKRGLVRYSNKGLSMMFSEVYQEGSGLHIKLIL